MAMGTAGLMLLGCPSPPEAVETPCTLEAVPWQPGESAFVEVTEEWGVEEIGARALRVSLLDVDGDGWTDLLVRSGGGPDDFGPEGTRNRWLLRNNGERRFEDITEASGLFRSRLDDSPGGRSVEVVASADVDNDGDVDVFTARPVQDPTIAEQDFSEMMLNDGSGVFQFGELDSHARSDYTTTTEARPTVPVGAALVDANRDGFVDLFISNNKRGDDSSPLQDRLFLGDGLGGFTDGTEDAGLTTNQWRDIGDLNQGGGHSWGWGATSCDLDDDGLPELLSASYGRSPNHLWHATGVPGDVGFVNESVSSGYGYDHRDEWWTNANAQCYCEDNPDAEDCDQAPEPDAQLCANLRASFGDNYRWSHSGDREAWRLGGNSATTTCADFDNDGRFDLLTGEIVHSDVGETSDPAEIAFNATVGPGEDIHFERPGNEATGLIKDRSGATYYDDGDMNNAVLDFDNDGYRDVYISSSDYPGTRGRLFHGLGERTFLAVDPDDGIDHRRSAGAASVDLDRDGDLDLVVGTSRMRCGGTTGGDCYEYPRLRIFENLANERGNNWLQVRLFGTGDTNAMAVGAKATVTRCDERSAAQVDGGHGHQGTQEDRVLHFGLGIVDEPVTVTVRWPDAEATTETFELEPDAMYDIVQGGTPTVWRP